MIACRLLLAAGLLFIDGLGRPSYCLFTAQAFSTEPTRTTAPRALPLADVQWDSQSFWGRRIEACRHGTLPAMTRLMQGRERSHFIENFRIAAGLAEGKHRGPAWNDGDTYKWLEALVATYGQTRDATLLETIDQSIEIIARAQRDDGYLHTPVLIASRQNPSSTSTDAQPFGDPVNFEMYNFGHLMTAACLHFEVTGERKFLDVAIKATDFLDREFSRPDRELARHAICPAHYMGIIDLYRVTGQARYLRLAERFLAMRDLVKGGDDNQDRVPFRQQREAVGHAVRANYLFAGAADLYLENRDKSLLEPLTSCWDSIQQKKLYITGGCGALFDGASPDGSKDQKEITRIHQAYGRNYQLPNSTAHNETCAAIGYVLWNYRMWQITHDGQYIDALENTLMNAVLAGVSLDGQRFFYTNTLRQLDDMPTQLRWSRQRQEWISCYCCPPNVARTIAACNRYAYAVETNALHVLLYGSNHLDTKLSDGQPLELKQSSSYPADGNITLTIENAPSYAYSIRLRVPGWCSQAKFSINGQPASLPADAGFVTIERNWRAGDRITLDFAMPARLVSAHPLVEECRGQVAVVRGPLVYCVESADLPKETSLHQIAIPADSTFQAAIGQAALKDIPQLETEISINTSSGRPGSALYSDYQKPTWQKLTTKLVPYFAWGNRGDGEMSVWLQVQP